jgi:RNA polymerase sigma factor (sigma-70 family)
MLGKDASDEDLVLSFQKTQSEKVFEYLYDRHASFVYRRSLLLTGSEADAQDLTQEIWTKVYFGMNNFRLESKFSHWLNRITINSCINFLKRRDKLFFSEDIERSANGSLAELNHILDVTKLLSQLSKGMKMLLTLKYVDELSYEEISELTGIGVSAVKMRIARAKEELIKYSSATDPK